MYYLLLVAATFLIGFQHISTKGYQKQNGNNLSSSLVFSLFTGLFASIIFFLLNKCKFEYSNFSLICAIILGISCVICMYFGIEVMSRGKMAIYTLFIMMGGMVLPFIYGAIYLHENVTVFKIIGLCILSLALMLPIFSANKADKEIKGNKVIYFIFCFILFTLNGFISVLIKHHQQNVNEAISSNGFGVLYFGFISITALIFIIFKSIFNLFKKNKAIKSGEPVDRLSAKFNKKAIFFCLLYSLFNGFASLFQFICAKNIDAVIMFPIFTGCTMIFTSLFGFLIFKEKLNKIQILSLLFSLIAIVLFAF